MQGYTDSEAEPGAFGDESQSGAEKSTERIYSEVPSRPSGDDEALTPDNVDGMTEENDDNNAEENYRGEGDSSDQALIEVTNTEPPPKPPHTHPEDLEAFASPQQHVYRDVADGKRPDAADIPLYSNLAGAIGGGGMQEDGETTDKTTKSKQKDKKKAIKRERFASYESVSLGDVSSVGRSTESIKETVRAAKRQARKTCAKQDCPRARTIFGILVGIGVGVLGFLLVYLLSGRHVLSAIVIALIIGVITANVLAFFDLSRLSCIALLIIPSVFSSGAKVCLWVLLVYFVISGPGCNLVENVQITAATRACFMGGKKTETSTRLLPTTPTAEQQTAAAQDDPTTQYFIKNIKQFQNLTDDLGHYLNETLTTNDTTLLAGRFCEEQLSKVQRRCSLMYESLMQNCSKTLRGWRLDSLCTRFIKRDRVCEHVDNPAFVLFTCGRVRSARERPLMEMIAMLQKQPRPTIEPSSEENPTQGHQTNNTEGAVTSFKSHRRPHYSSKDCRMVVILELLVTALIFAILYEAYRYHKHYLVYNEFDNCYLTVHFGSIENNRRANGATDGLMPLKKSELQLYVQPASCGLSRAEKTSVLKCLVFFVVHTVFVLLLLLGDYFFYQAITRHEPGMDTRTNGTLSGCDAGLKIPDEEYTVVITSLLSVLLMLIVLQPYALRLRRYIAGRLYKTRERTRVTYLYYKILEERKAFYKSTIEKINRSSEENAALKRLDAVLVLAQRFPALGKVLGFIGFSLERCMVCGTRLSRKYVICDTKNCNAVYCRMCFWDVESNCLGCLSRRTRLSTGARHDGNENDYV